MAGSYGHVRPVNRDKNHDAGSWSMIENMGDAHECVHQLLWLTLFFARQYSGQTLEDIDEIIEKALEEFYYPMLRLEKPRDTALNAVDDVMNDRLAALDLDTATVARESYIHAERAHREVEERIREIVRDELLKLPKRHK